MSSYEKVGSKKSIEREHLFDDLLTSHEMADKLRISMPTLLKMVKEKGFPVIRTGGGLGSYRFNYNQVLDYLFAKNN